MKNTANGSRIAAHPLFFFAALKTGSTREMPTTMKRRHLKPLEPVQNSRTKKS
jgi:hypothetical protein